ncbi:BREX-2 system phosphatase PglZ [Desertimonas flava]|uniref:BREX-2 system phosphatase PglZ n=1 Tax=Desertimonas flava TaxID=2064846 RepID=UPI000E356260|nr:BREX-2 system phosphatase PglZ [Desertimonas flava]
MTPDVQQIQALAATVSPDSVALAVRAEPTWTGPEIIDTGRRPIRVKACASPLAVRAAVADAESAGSGELLAVITPCGDHELGHDLLARLAKHRVLPVDPFAAVLGLFRAEVLDPALAREDRWLVDELISVAPPGGWPFDGLVGGVLDRDTAWEVWHEARFGGLAQPETLDDVLVAAATPMIGSALAGLPVEQRQKVAARWAGGVAPTDVLVELAATGRSTDVIALGFVAGALHAATTDPGLARQQRDARIRFEPLLGRDRLAAASAAAWAKAATAYVGDDETRLAFCDRAQALLDEHAAGDLAVLSDALPAGFDLRLGRVAAAVAADDAVAATEGLEWLSGHRLGSTRRRRTLTAAAAVRAVRRGQRSRSGSRFADLARDYTVDGAWVDEVRRLLADGDQLATVATAYERVCRRLDDERRAGDMAFATALEAWARIEPVASDDVVPVERILDEIVAPVARDAPVLLIVSDGTSLAVANELLRELRNEQWLLAAPADRTAWPTGVAMLPTITEVSRASLLSGRRVDGAQQVERDGFTRHAALRAASPATRPPVLFHKGQLVGASGWTLAEDVQRQIADPEQRIVGVVLNAVDDHLSRGQQLQIEWGLETFRPLGALLDAAHEGGRVVIMTADHGHVIHGAGAVSRPAGAGQGERWRTSPPAPADDELEFTGPRVLKGGRVVLPVDERVRYGGHKHGYHGGATPQEVLVPIAVLARTLPDGWHYLPVRAPDWWTGTSDSPDAPPPSAVPVPSRSDSAAPTLFEEASPSTPADAPRTWLDVLVSSSAFTSRVDGMKPRPMPTERIARYLAAIVTNGGSIPLEVLARIVNEPRDQLRMALTLVQRLVNIDGAEVLAVRADGSVQTVVLNAALLATQFGVDGP